MVWSSLFGKKIVNIVIALPGKVAALRDDPLLSWLLGDRDATTGP